MCTAVSSTQLMHPAFLCDSGTYSNEKPSMIACLATSSYYLSSSKPPVFFHRPRCLVILSHRGLSNYVFAQRAEYRAVERGRNQLFGGSQGVQVRDQSVGEYIGGSVLSQRNKGSRQHIVIKCTASEEAHADRPIELPIFPLPLVLFPGAILPLQIFEFRYRIMMHTLLQTDLRFGVVYTDKGTGIAVVGCVGEVIKHERLVDDRFFMICKGQERFRVLSMVRTKPYLVAQVEWLEDKPSQEAEDVETLATEVETYMKDVIRISNRVNGKPDKDVPDDLRKKLFPTPFSFWVGSTFEGAPVEQQALLELEDTAVRLKREKETLRNTLNYLTAASAVKDAFPSME
jgi:Lon protease-like protein